MSIFQCENCGCAENTALACQGIKGLEDWFSWDGIEDRKGKKLCSACAPKYLVDGAPSDFGVWHDKFKRIYYQVGSMKTDNNGNLTSKTIHEARKK